MSDLLIRGMEMPKDRGVYIAIDIDGQAYTKPVGALNWKNLKQKAVPVPPHGRLVDAWYIRDAIIQKWMDKACDSQMYKCGMEDAYEVIRNAPTIIQASEEKE